MKRTRSIRGKLTGIIMLTSTIAVLLACLGFVISDLYNSRIRRTEDLGTLAQVVGSNCTAALTFGDRQAAREVLDALRAKPSIIAAVVYTERGELFAHYSPNASVSLPAILPQEGFHGRGDRLELVYAIRLDQERIGTLYIASDARDRSARLKQYAMIAAGIVLVSLLIAFVLSSRLQRSISEPIVELARIAGLVSQHKNFSVRASRPGSNVSDEIGNLMTGFNGMLAEIEQRDDNLLQHQARLEETVSLRTGELTTANEELLVAKNAAEKVAEINVQRARESALILNSATDGILGVGLDNRVTFLNPAGARMLGMRLADLEAKSIHEAIHHSHADGTPWSEADCANTQAMRRGETLAITEDTFWRRDGASFPVEYSSTPMVDQDGNHHGAVVVFRDVTERRVIDRLKSEFVSTVSHELRTPLTSIRGALGLLSSGMLGNVAPKGQRMLEIAVSNTDRLVRLINDILDLERMGSGKIELVLSVANADDLITQAVEGVNAMAQQAEVDIVVESIESPVWVDSDRIMQTLTNLLSNAIKFSAPGTMVTLSGTPRPDGGFTFCVADQGRGVPEDKLETIFERFKQVDASDSRDKGGSGLGLAICRSIVNAHGGRIWAERDGEKGSLFQFTIPARPILLREDDLSSTATMPSAEVACAGPTILIVEDDLDLARVMTTSLQARGIKMIHAARGSEAIDLCRQHDPTLIVLDLSLPDMDGFAVVKSLREDATLGRVPLLVYSAMEVDSAEQARLTLGPTTFLIKSRCSLQEFESHVVRLLNTVTARAEEDQHAA